MAALSLGKRPLHWRCGSLNQRQRLGSKRVYAKIEHMTGRWYEARLQLETDVSGEAI